MQSTINPLYWNASCSDLYDVVVTAPNESRPYCSFINSVDSCQFDSGFFQYNTFVFCYFDSPYVATVILILWLALLLVTIATTADSFFGPCLIVVTKLTGMSQNLAGVTLLAFGNGCADIFSSITAVNSLETGDAGLVFGALLGAGLFVNCVTGGATMIIKPFTSARRPILKDLLFYLITVSWVFSILLKGYISMAEAISFICLYVIYVVVTVTGRAIYSKQKSKRILLIAQTPTETVEDRGKTNIQSATNTVIPTIIIEGPGREADIVLPSLAGASSIDFLSPDNISVQPQWVDRRLPTQLNRPRASTDQQAGGSHSFNEGSSTANSFSKTDENRKLLGRRSIPGLTRNRVYLARWVMAHFEDTDEPSMSERPEKKFLKRRDTPKERHFSASEADDRIGKNLSLTLPNGVDNPHLADLAWSLPIHAGVLLPLECEMSPTIFHDELSREATKGSSQSTLESKRGGESGFENHAFARSQESLHDPIGYMTSEEGITSSSCTTEELKEYIYPGMWRNLLDHLNPIDVDEWPTMSYLSRAFEIFRSPILLIIRVFTPVVLDEHPIKAWCKILNTAQCVLTPVYWLLATKTYNVNIGSGIPLIVLIIFIGICLAILVWFTSTAEKPPSYHGIFAVIGFITSIIWIYIVASEVVNMLNTLGLTFCISQAILGLTLLAFANSVGDMMSNLVLAKNNYPKIAYSACVGGPLFNALLGIGLPFTFKTISSGGSFQIEASLVQFVIPGFLIFALIYEIILIPIMRFQLRPLFGVSLICIYSTFLVVAILCEVGVITLPQK